MLCPSCKDNSNVGTCVPCADILVEEGMEWVGMIKRLRSGTPRMGEEFSILRQVIPMSNEFLAMESIGSTYVSAQISRAGRFPSEAKARMALEL